MSHAQTTRHGLGVLAKHEALEEAALAKQGGQVDQARRPARGGEARVCDLDGRRGRDDARKREKTTKRADVGGKVVKSLLN